MAKGLFDDQSIDIPCPECRKKTARTVAQIKRQPKLTCSGCGGVIDIDAKELLRELDKAEKQARDMFRGLR